MTAPAVDYYLVSAARRAHRLRPGRPYCFGREEGVDILLQDALVSRRHAEVRWADEGYWFVVDLGSRNGVLVNNVRLAQPTRLEDGTQIQIGGQIFRLHMLPPGGDPASLMQQAPQISSLETMGPGLSLADIATQGATFTGELTSGVMDLIQYFQVTAKTGRLDLTDGPAISSVWVLQGTPIHATAQAGAITGMDALVQLAKHPPKRFAFHADATPPTARTIGGSAAGVMMEVARQLDEAQR